MAKYYIYLVQSYLGEVEEKKERDKEIHLTPFLMAGSGNPEKLNEERFFLGQDF